MPTTPPTASSSIIGPNGEPCRVVSEKLVESRGADGKPVVYTAVRIAPCDEPPGETVTSRE